MARRERLVADPEEVAFAGRMEVDLHEGAIQVGEAGIDWGDYEIKAFMAKQDMGEIPVDSELPNRVIEIPLVLGAEGDFDQARITVSAWAARVNQQSGVGGHLKREIIGGSYGEAGSKLFCDCVKATLSLSGDTASARDGVDANALLTVEALPDFYGEKIEEPTFEGNGEAAETFQIKGNLPGRAEITIEEKSGRNQLGLLWHFRCQDYDPEAPWGANVSTFERFGAAEEATIAGSIATKVVRHPSLGTSWTPVAAETIKHKGVHEYFVRCYSASEVPPEVRLLYDVGDLINPSETRAKVLWGSNGFYLMSLGVINLEQLPVGDHQAKVLLQARGAAGGENVSFDRRWMLSAAESSGTPTAPRRVVEGMSAPLVYDGFNQSAGNATGKSPQVGSAYVVATGSDTTDFTIDATSHRLVRSSTSDSGTINGLMPGRAIGSGSAKLRNHRIVTDLGLPGGKSAVAGGHIVRWADASNFVAAYLEESVVPGESWHLVVVKVEAGVRKIWTTPLRGGLLRGGELIGRLETLVHEGLLMVSLDGVEIYVAEHSAMAVGSLEEGRAFVYDHNVEAEVKTRSYDNLEIAPVIGFDAVNFANKSAWLSHEGLYRQGPTGESYGPIPKQVSDLPRVPVSGSEELPVELAVKTSRGDLETVQDGGNGDKLAVQLAYRPCWSSVPGL